MTEIAKSDLFFIITSISVISLTVILAIVLFYVFSIVKKVNKIVGKVKEESENAIEDIRELRAKLKADGSAIRGISIVFGLIKNMVSGKKSKKR